MNKLIYKKYLFKNRDTASENICVRFVCGTVQEHEELADAIKNDDKVVFCACEYVHEIDIEAMSTPTIVKNVCGNMEGQKNETL